MILLLCSIAAIVPGGTSCDQRARAPADAIAPSVASLVPAATDLILAMGAADHLVAVSTYDADRPEARDLPRVGDYETTDWEQVRAIRPAVMIRQFAPQRLPPGLARRAQALHIRLVNLHVETVSDVFKAVQTLGQVLEEPVKAAKLVMRLRGQLEGVRRRTCSLPRPRVLLVLDPEGQAVIGPNGFLEELLLDAGGANAAAGLGQRYPSIDREMLRKIDPDVIVQLLPRATAPLLAKARRTWEDQPDLKAVRTHRVYTLTQWYLLLPGSHIGDFAEQLAELLHPQKMASTPATRP